MATGAGTSTTGAGPIAPPPVTGNQVTSPPVLPPGNGPGNGPTPPLNTSSGVSNALPPSTTLSMQNGTDIILELVRDPAQVVTGYRVTISTGSTDYSKGIAQYEVKGQLPDPVANAQAVEAQCKTLLNHLQDKRQEVNGKFVNERLQAAFNVPNMTAVELIAPAVLTYLQNDLRSFIGDSANPAPNTFNKAVTDYNATMQAQAQATATAAGVPPVQPTLRDLIRQPAEQVHEKTPTAQQIDAAFTALQSELTRVAPPATPAAGAPAPVSPVDTLKTLFTTELQVIDQYCAQPGRNYLDRINKCTPALQHIIKQVDQLKALNADPVYQAKLTDLDKVMRKVVTDKFMGVTESRTTSLKDLLMDEFKLKIEANRPAEPSKWNGLEISRDADGVYVTLNVEHGRSSWGRTQPGEIKFRIGDSSMPLAEVRDLLNRTLPHVGDADLRKTSGVISKETHVGQSELINKFLMAAQSGLGEVSLMHASGIVFDGLNISGANFDKVKFKNCEFLNCNISASFNGTIFENSLVHSSRIFFTGSQGLHIDKKSKFTTSVEVFGELVGAEIAGKFRCNALAIHDWSGTQFTDKDAGWNCRGLRFLNLAQGKNLDCASLASNSVELNTFFNHTIRSAVLGWRENQTSLVGHIASAKDFLKPEGLTAHPLLAHAESQTPQITAKDKRVISTYDNNQKLVVYNLGEGACTIKHFILENGDWKLGRSGGKDFIYSFAANQRSESLQTFWTLMNDSAKVAVPNAMVVTGHQFRAAQAAGGQPQAPAAGAAAQGQNPAGNPQAGQAPAGSAQAAAAAGGAPAQGQTPAGTTAAAAQVQQTAGSAQGPDLKAASLALRDMKTKIQTAGKEAEAENIIKVTNGITDPKTIEFVYAIAGTRKGDKNRLELIQAAAALGTAQAADIDKAASAVYRLVNPKGPRRT